MHKIKAILFDLDGVLVYAKDWHYEAFNLALQHFNYPPISYEDHLERFDGLPTRNKIAMLARELTISPSQVEEINLQKQRYTQEIAAQRCAPTPAHLAMLERLKTEGYRMAVCSNSVRSGVNQLLTLTALMPFFEFTLSNEDVARPKPHPEIYMTAIRRLHLLPGECLVLEDHPRGIAAGKGAGAPVLVIPAIEHTNYDNIKRAIARLEAGAVL